MASVQDSTGLSPRLYRPHPQPQLASPPAPLRMERGVICEATPIGLLKEGEGTPNGQRESYEAVPRRPEQQGTEGPALSMSPVFSVPLLPCLSHTLSPYPPYPAPASALCYSQNLFICYPVSYYKQLVYPSTRPPVNLPRYPVFLIPYSCLSHTLSLHQPSVTPRTCSSVTLSFSYPIPLSTLPCPYPVTKKVKLYSFTFFFFPLLSLLMRSRAVITKTYFVCPP